MSRRRNTGQPRSVAQRVDELVRKAGLKLAGTGSSRRGFLGGVGKTFAVVSAATILGKADEAQAACSLPAGCFGTVDVNVCYTPWVVTRAEAGQSGLVLRKGPSFSADPVTRSDTGGPIVIPVGGHFGRVSNRTGSVSAGCPDPGPRANQNGFLWGYWAGYKRQGWMPYSVAGTTYATGDTGYTGTMCGPASADFDCRDPKSACPSYNGCGGADAGSPTCSVTIRPIVAVGTDLSDEKYYLRYAANSTTFFWLVPGDYVKRYAYKDGGTYNWSCVEVICAQYAPNGCRGWVRSDALGSPVSSASACFPSLTCPSGSSG